MAQKKPIHRIPLGNIEAAIWANETKDQKTWFNVTLSRSYKDEDQWRDTNSFRHGDLPVAALALGMAYVWLWDHQMKEKQARKGTQAN